MGFHIWFMGKILVKDLKAFLLNFKLLNADINEMAFPISCLFSCLAFNKAPFFRHNFFFLKKIFTR